MLKNEKQYQMYLNLVDIVDKSGFAVKAEKDGMGLKISSVVKDYKPCGQILVCSTPPANRQGFRYNHSAHANLTAMKDKIRGESGQYTDFVEGSITDNDGSLWYFGHTNNTWVTIAEEKFPSWEETTPKYMKLLEEKKVLEKRRCTTAAEYEILEGEFSELAEKFTSIQIFRDSPEQAAECKVFVNGLKETHYKDTCKALDKLERNPDPTTSKEIAKVIKKYEIVQKRFIAIELFDDSIVKIDLCTAKLEDLNKKYNETAYAEANQELSSLKGRPEMATAFEYFNRSRQYKKTATKFESCISHDDAKELAKECTKQFKDYRWKFVKKIAPFVGIAIGVIALIIFIVVLVS